ncbi:MAG: hypothetical protein ABI539_15510 [Acidobacteriota bacterium]
MRIFLCGIFVLGVLIIAVPSVSAQCDRSSLSPIPCGYYDEGYIDGGNDSRNRQNSDFRHYRSKFNNQYESYYRQGYEAGYAGASPMIRWTTAQRNAYDSGYQLGQNDRRTTSSTLARTANTGILFQYFQQGYNDGYAGRRREYDVAIGGDTGYPENPNYPENPSYPGNPNYPGYPGPGSSTGSVTWSGRVDNRTNIILRGGTIRTEVLAGTGIGQSETTSGAVLPRRAVNVIASRENGRGTISVVQQPNRSNDFTAIIQVSDSAGGADNYRIRISWQPGAYQPEEPYRSGSVRWSGRVDQTANIVISGSDVQSYNVTGNGVTGVNFNVNGYLAARPGNVTVRKRDGRGTVSVLQQPSAENDYVAVIQIFDPDGGDGRYDIEINW